jgi:hypothetical protein
MDAYTLALREFNAFIIKGIIPERLKDRANSAGGGTLTGEHKRNPGRNQHSTNDSGDNRRFSMRHWKKTCCSGTSGVMNRIKRSAYLTFLMDRRSHVFERSQSGVSAAARTGSPFCAAQPGGTGVQL